jgi:hypothetical protein
MGNPKSNFAASLSRSSTSDQPSRDQLPSPAKARFAKGVAMSVVSRFSLLRQSPETVADLSVARRGSGAISA